jgi:transposase
MLEQLMHEAQMMKQQGKRIGQIAEALGKSERMVHYYLSEPSRPRKKRKYASKLDPFKPTLILYSKKTPHSMFGIISLFIPL